MLRKTHHSARRKAALAAASLALASVSGANAANQLPLQPDVVFDDSVVLGRVSDIATDSSGNVYVLDSGFHSIHVYTNDGTFVRSIGGEGDGPGEFRMPRALAIDSHDRIYVAGASDRITVMDTVGNGIRTVLRRRNEIIRSMRFGTERHGTEGDLFLTYLDPENHNTIHRMSQPLEDGEVTLSFCDSYAAGKDVDPRTEQVYGGGFIDIAADGRLWYLQMTPQRVRVFEPDGRVVAEHDVRFQERDAPPEPDQTRGSVVFTAPPLATKIVALSDGRFLVTEVYGSETERYSLVDLYDANGRRQGSEKRELGFAVVWADEKDRVYSVEETEDERIRVVRYVVVE
ncbi:MAG: 6-bladed beta-propeller [Candidatus Eisenbacteria bacterium]